MSTFASNQPCSVKMAPSSILPIFATQADGERKKDTVLRYYNDLKSRPVFFFQVCVFGVAVISTVIIYGFIQANAAPVAPYYLQRSSPGASWNNVAELMIELFEEIAPGSTSNVTLTIPENISIQDTKYYVINNNVYFKRKCFKNVTSHVDTTRRLLKYEIGKHISEEQANSWESDFNKTLEIVTEAVRKYQNNAITQNATEKSSKFKLFDTFLQSEGPDLGFCLYSLWLFSSMSFLTHLVLFAKTGEGKNYARLLLITALLCGVVAGISCCCQLASMKAARVPFWTNTGLKMHEGSLMAMFISETVLLSSLLVVAIVETITGWYKR
ncbi:hypothetical protein RJF_2020 [Candidozyma auris]|nr:hypothetical protein CA7LBN_004467 [[Candida] auris]